MRTAAVFGPLEGWRDALEAAGIELRSAAAGVDLAVATPDRLDEVTRSATRTLLVEGSVGARHLRALGPQMRWFLPLPAPERPELFLPFDQPQAAGYALTEWIAPAARWKRARNRLLARLIERRLVPRGRPLLALRSADARPPFLIAATDSLGLPRQLGFFLEPGVGDDLSRGVFHLFRPGASRPEWVLKYARVRNYADAFDRDERGLTTVGSAGGSAAAHAPRLVGRFEVDGHQASVESAATGRRLIAVLNGDGSRSSLLAIVERIAAWIVAVGRETRGAPAGLEPERARLAQTVLPHWGSIGFDERLVLDLPPIPSVLAHNDLGSWNVVVNSADFKALDWEAARANAFPLWDLWYFLADALAQLDGGATLAEKETHFSRLFAGELATSELLFRWTAEAANACGVPADAVGPLATLCWLHHGRSHIARAGALEQHGGAASPPVYILQSVSRLWCTQPGLGPGWDRWRS